MTGVSLWEIYFLGCAEKRWNSSKNYKFFEKYTMFPYVENLSWPRVMIHASKTVCTIRWVQKY